MCVCVKGYLFDLCFGLFAKHSLTKIFDSIIEMNENKKGGRIRLIEIDQLLKNGA
jgi:hypothetical protein